MTSIPERRRFAWPRVPRWRFSLRVMLAIVVLSAVVLGVIVAPYHRKARAIARLNELGAVYYFDYQLDAMGPNGQPIGDEPPRNAWWKRLLGEHYASNVIEVQLFSRAPREKFNFTDADARLLTALPTIEYLILRNTQLTDDGMLTFADLPALKSLDVRGSATFPAGAAKFKARRPEVELQLGPEG